MADAGLAGLFRGIAASPLGNLPGLMVAREELQHQREMRADTKAFKGEFERLINEGDLAGAKTLALGKGNFELADYMDRREREEQDVALSQVYAEGGLPAVHAAALEIGRPDLVTKFEDMAHQRASRGLGLEGMQVDIDAARQRMGLASTAEARAGETHRADMAASGVKTATERFKLGQARRAQFATEIEGMLAGLGPNASADDVESVLTHFTQSNSEMMRKAYRLPKHRIPVGFQAVTGPGGEMFVVPTIYNPETESTGPMTDKATSDLTDTVRPMRLSSFLGMLRGQATAGTKKKTGTKAAGPFAGTSMDAQYQNILLTGDPSSPEYRAAYQAFGQPKVRLDPTTGNAIVTRPDMTHFRSPTGGATAMPAPDGSTGRGGGLSIESVPGAEGRFTEAQMRSVDAATRVRSGLEVLGNASDMDDGTTVFETLAGLKEDTLSKVPFGNYALSPDYQKAKQAMADIASALLRLETGAAAPEFERIELQERYSPRPGDSREVVEQKWQSLQRRWRNAESLAGPAYEKQFGRTAPDTPTPLHSAATVTPAGPDDVQRGAATVGLGDQGSVTRTPVEPPMPIDFTAMNPEEFGAFQQQVLADPAQYPVETLSALADEWDRRQAATEAGFVPQAPPPEGNAAQAALAGGTPTPQGTAAQAALAGGSPTPSGDAAQAALAGGTPTLQGATAQDGLVGNDVLRRQPTNADMAAIQQSVDIVRNQVARAPEIPAAVRTQVDQLLAAGRFAAAAELLRNSIPASPNRDLHEASNRLDMLALLEPGGG